MLMSINLDHKQHKLPFHHSCLDFHYQKYHLDIELVQMNQLGSKYHLHILCILLLLLDSNKLEDMIKALKFEEDSIFQRYMLLYWLN